MKNRLVIEGLVSEFSSQLYLFAFALTGDEGEAKNLVQQTFLLLYEKYEKVLKCGNVKYWLFATILRIFPRTLKKGQKQKRSEIALKPRHEADPFVDSTGSCSEDGRGLLGALRGLEEDNRTVLALFYVADLSYKEISCALCIPIEAVMSRLSRAKEQLRKILNESKTAEGHYFSKAII